jgi:hypothetical protein
LSIAVVAFASRSSTGFAIPNAARCRLVALSDGYVSLYANALRLPLEPNSVRFPATPIT